jgi:hypothetical protein
MPGPWGTVCPPTPRTRCDGGLSTTGGRTLSTNTSSPGYQLAQQNAEAGKLRVHNYIAAQPDNPANVVTTRVTNHLDLDTDAEASHQ